MSKCVGIFTPKIQKKRRQRPRRRKKACEKKWHTTFMRTLTHQQQSIKLNKFVAGRFFRDFLFFSLLFSLFFAHSLVRWLSVFIFIIVSNVWLNYLERALLFCAFDSIRVFDCIFRENTSITMRSDPMRWDAMRCQSHIHSKSGQRRTNQQQSWTKHLPFCEFFSWKKGARARKKAGERECKKS